jgi:hypothetical protein
MKKRVALDGETNEAGLNIFLTQRSEGITRSMMKPLRA